MRCTGRYAAGMGGGRVVVVVVGVDDGGHFFVEGI